MPVERQFKADLLLLTVTLLAAAGWVFSKEALQGLPPLLFIGLRFLLAGGVLSVAGWSVLRLLSRRNVMQSIGVGVLFGGAMMFWILGLHHATHLGEGAFITSLGIVLVPVIARFVFGDVPPRSTWIALPVAVLGFACLSLEGGFSIELGQIFFLLSALMFSFLFNFNSRVVMNIPAIALTSIQLVVVGLVALPVSMLLESWPSGISLPILGWLLASALIATTMRFFLQVTAQGMTTASHAAVMMMMEPIWTALLAALWFGERMGPLQALGCLLIFLALVINRWMWVRRLLKGWLPARV